jgi:hypothetical protein
LFKFGLKLRTTLEDVVLRGQAFLEFLRGSVKYGGTESGGR